MKKIIFITLLVFFTFLLVGSVSAVDIVYDNFEDGNLNEWTLTRLGTANYWASSTTNPYQGSYHAQSQPTYTTEPASVMQRNISTFGYENIVFRYYKRNIGLDAADEFQVEWYNGTGWTILEQTGSSSSNDAAYVLKEFTLPSSAGNNPNVKIRFECTAGAVSEYCRIDNVNVSGTAIVGDTTSPYFTSIPSPITITYGQGFGVDFDAQDETSFGSYSINWTNYFSINQSGYLKNTTQLAVGIYNINVSINDSSGNTNSTIYQVVVNKASQSITPLLNGVNSNLVISYPQQVNASGTTSAGSLIIYRDGVIINNGINYSLAAGYYRFDFNVTGNQNYTDAYGVLFANVNKATSTIEMYINGTARNQTDYYGVQTNVSVSLGNSEQTIILYKNGIDDTPNLNVYQILGIGDYNFTAVAGSTQNYILLTITRHSHILCKENLQNTSWSSWINLGGCKIDDLQEQVRNRTQYDANSCGYVNTTFYEYQNVSCNYCSYSNVNTSWSNWYYLGLCDVDDLREKQRNLTEYDENYNSCYAITGLPSDLFENVTHFENGSDVCNYCSYNVVNSSWSEWENISCLINNLMNQSRFKTEYDKNYETCYAITRLPSDLWNSGNNNTYYEYRQTEFCDYCTPNLLNTTKGDWYFTEDCQPDDLRNRQRNWTQYDINDCGEVENQTYYENESVVCNFLTITCEVGGPYQQGALVLFIGNVTNSTNVLVGENVDIDLYKNNLLNLSRILQTSEDGDFETSFSNLGVGNYKINANVSYLGANRTCSKNFEIGSAASLVLDKTASIHNISNNEIFYNISLRILNIGGSNCINLSLSDADYGFYELGKISPGEIIVVSYLMNFTRQNSTNYYLLESTGISGIDSYSDSLIRANSSSMNLIIPSSSYSPGKQVVIIKNIIYSQETRLNVSYNVSVSLYNTGDEDLENINYIDSDFNSGILLNLSRGNFKEFSNLVIIDKAASNIEYEFALGSITIGSLVFYSNRPKINIPGYGGPADLYVYAPASVQVSSDFDSMIEILNMNPDIGQDFIIDYWVTNNDESINYSSGQKTVYVSALGRTNVSVNLISPASVGNYKLKAIVSWINGIASSFDSFEVVSEQIVAPPTSGGGGGGSIGIIKPKESKEINITKEPEGKPGAEEKEEIICNPPYIRYGKECCLDENNNSICDNDEKRGITGLFLREDGEFYVNYSLIGLLLLLLLIIFIIYKLIRRLPKLFAKPRKKKNIMKLRDVKGMKVYSLDGIEIGKVVDIFLKNNKIEGLKIKLIKKKSKKIKKKGILLNYRHVNNIGDIVIIDERVIDFFENINL